MACNIYPTKYSKTEKSTNNNSNKGNDKDQNKSDDDGDDNDEKKDGLISAHITGGNKEWMDSAAAILVTHATNNDMWEMEGEKISSLVVDNKLICCHMVTPPVDESDIEEPIISDELLDGDWLEDDGVLFQILFSPNFCLNN